ncbi:MAG TPA: right-handed parallel beta-helix repeat-containing protein [Jiangellaceae bacterium]|nr:right-handed parallel beta-helix repeat-containing protein [Jiangellaceae bacterium]
MVHRRRLAGTAGIVAVLAILAAPTAAAHADREVVLPDGTGSVPEYRTADEAAEILLVCSADEADFESRVAGFPAELRQRNLDLFAECQDHGFATLQAAVDAVTQPEANIYLLPGEYREEPSRPDPIGECAELDRPWYDGGHYEYQLLEFDDQVACPTNQNLVAILGIRDLQIEGTGAEPGDVILDAGYTKLNALRADRADGIYLKNFTAQRTTFNAIYIIETQGFVIDQMIGRWNDEYGFLTFAVDHGLYTGCEAYGNGDSGIYPGSASDINKDRGYDVDRYSVEITGCYSHHNLLGYSGTAGDSVWAHDNDFSNNTVGLAMDSLFPDHPGLPQNHSKFEDNRIYDNNEDYYGNVRDGTCSLPSEDRSYEDGVVCPAIGVPPGTGLLTAGGNYNVFRDNWVYGNDYAGFLLLHPPAFVRGETGLTTQWDTSHNNTYIGNRFGVTPDGESQPNRLDVWWDGQGTQNCWQPDTGDTVPLRLPECGSEPGEFSGPQTSRVFAEPATLASLYVCGEYSLSELYIPSGCEWLGASGLGRLDVQLTLASSALVGIVGLLIWWRRLRQSRLVAIASVVGFAGLVLNVIVVPQWHTVLPAVAIALIGGWLVALGVAVRRAGYSAFGWLTVAFGALALLHAVDKAVVMLPWIPLSPGWFRLLVGIVWIVWGVIVAAPLRRTAPGVTTEPAHAAV